MASTNFAFLNELLQSIGARMLPGALASASQAGAERVLLDGCAELMRHSGEASRIVIADRALEAYGRLDRDARLRFFRVLLSDYGADPQAIRAAFSAWDATGDEADLAALVRVVEPKRQMLLRLLNHPPCATLELVRMRRDLLSMLRDAPELAPLDADFSHLFASWFNRGFLVLRRIDWNTSAAILDKIVAYEAVHEIRDWYDLRRRLEPADRRCYGFFHPATGDEPLIFVEVALTEGIPDAIGPLLQQQPRAEPDTAPDTAVFYSISNCQPGLKGVSFGNFLIKQVVQELSRELPALKSFVTLSPAPGFARWLAEQPEPEAQALSDALAARAWVGDEAACLALAPKVQTWAARYFVQARTPSGAPLDPVARFHLGNGASAHRVNWPADLADGALSRAHGLMINYLYEPDRIEANHEAYAREYTIVQGPHLRRALRGARAARAGGPPADKQERQSQ